MLIHCEWDKWVSLDSVKLIYEKEVEARKGRKYRQSFLETKDGHTYRVNSDEVEAASYKLIPYSGPLKAIVCTVWKEEGSEEFSKDVSFYPIVGFGVRTVSGKHEALLSMPIISRDFDLSDNEFLGVLYEDGRIELYEVSFKDIDLFIADCIETMKKRTNED